MCSRLELSTFESDSIVLGTLDYRLVGAVNGYDVNDITKIYGLMYMLG